jgi:hypothetical protein
MNINYQNRWKNRWTFNSGFIVLYPFLSKSKIFNNPILTHDMIAFQASISQISPELLTSVRATKSSNKPSDGNTFRGFLI